MIEVSVVGDDECNGKFYDAYIEGKFKFKAEDLESFDLDKIIEKLSVKIRKAYKDKMEFDARSLQWHADHAQYCMKGSKHAGSYSPDYGDYL